MLNNNPVDSASPLPIKGEMPAGQRGSISVDSASPLPIMGEMPAGQRGSSPNYFKTASPDRYGLLKEFAKENRNNQTEAESVLWMHIKGKALGAKFLRQHIIYDYIADFVCLEQMLVVEVDGGYHFQPEQMVLDAYRVENLEKFGFRVVRFTNEEVLCDTDNVLTKIKNALIERDNQIVNTKKI